MIFFFLFFLLIPVGNASECPDADAATVKRFLKGRGETEIIFFASWCASCKPYLTASHAPSTVYIAIFDEKERAEKVLRSFNIEEQCFTSDDFAKELGVRFLPASRKLALY